MPSSQQNDHSEQDLEMVSSQPENREQTFDEKLDAIIWELTDSSGWDLIGITQAQADALSEQLQSERAEAKQAIKTLVLEDVVGRETATYHHHPFLSDYAIAQIHISVNDMMLYDKSQHFTKETREWFETRINEVISRQLEVKCENTLRSKQHQIINPQKEEEK